MAHLIFFDDERHEYTVNGEKLPCVSYILRFLSREVYQDMQQHVLDRAASRGKYIHAACEQLDKYRTVECDEEYIPYLKAYSTFLREHSVEWLEIEKRFYHIERMYAGTIDRYGIVNGKKSLVDIKTSCTIHKPLVKAQLNGYNDMRLSNGIDDVENLYCLHLKNDGKYTVYDVSKDMTEFDCCYNLHISLAKKHSRGKVE